MSQNPKDNSKVFCYWGPDTPGGEEAAICEYKQDGFYLDGELQIEPTWWEYLAEFESPADARLRTALRVVKDELTTAHQRIKELEAKLKQIGGAQ